MNRKQWKAQQYGSHVNSWWLTWSRDDRNRRKLELRDFLKDLGVFLFFLAVTLALYWGLPSWD